jgi:Trk K+ transport system NAD-binding subunit
LSLLAVVIADTHLPRRAGDTLIVLGSRGQVERLEQLMRGK